MRSRDLNFTLHLLIQLLFSVSAFQILIKIDLIDFRMLSCPSTHCVFSNNISCQYIWYLQYCRIRLYSVIHQGKAINTNHTCSFCSKFIVLNSLNSLVSRSLLHNTDPCDCKFSCKWTNVFTR